MRIRVSGQTDWKRVWMVISSSADAQAPGEASSITSGQQPPTARGKKRMSNLFSRDQSPPRPVGPVKPTIHMYPGQKHKDRKKPLLTMTNVSQAFAVYPERPELISRSTLMKVEGLLGDEEMGMSMRRREGWLLVMPESETGVGQASEMLKWIIGAMFCDLLYSPSHINPSAARRLRAVRTASCVDLGSSRSCLAHVRIPCRAAQRCT